MKGKNPLDKYHYPLCGKSSTNRSLHRKPLARIGILGLFCILASTLSGAFEGSDLFRIAFAGIDGILPPTMNSPARLPDQPVWLSLGHGRPWDCKWAAYSTASFGGRVGSWRAAGGVWYSGDELYRETSLSAAAAGEVRKRLIAGLSLAWHEVNISGYDPIEGELLLGIGLNAPLTETLNVAVWYSGQTPGRKQAYESLTRQLYQLAVISRIGKQTTWTLAVEKTPPLALRQLAEVCFATRKNLTFQIGYRTIPSMPYAGAQVDLRRLQLSARLNYHPIFGLSTAFGFAFK
ncbi:MAG: hypothetical protein JSU77_10635 [Fidelibacterota bacterium]|nr:MAG: hypothetical protein JSU77_10635 [Candidatus Neomarinimicrobiota bacterium]